MDEHIGVPYTVDDRCSWTWVGSSWEDIYSAREFTDHRGHRPYPGVCERASLGAMGSRLAPGSAEEEGYAGQFDQMKSWSMKAMQIENQPTMVAVVDLNHGDYIGPVPGKLHFSPNQRNGHETCIEDPEAVHSKPTPGPLWPLLATCKVKKSNAIIVR
jgi:hypothetical protein